MRPLAKVSAASRCPPRLRICPYSLRASVYAALDEGVGRLLLTAAALQLPIELARLGVFAEIVQRHHQVQLRLGVVGVQDERALEPILGEDEGAGAVRDDTQHVEDVREAVRVLGDLS